MSEEQREFFDPDGEIARLKIEQARERNEAKEKINAVVSKHFEDMRSIGAQIITQRDEVLAAKDARIADLEAQVESWKREYNELGALLDETQSKLAQKSNIQTEST